MSDFKKKIDWLIESEAARLGVELTWITAEQSESPDFMVTLRYRRRHDTFTIAGIHEPWATDDATLKREIAAHIVALCRSA